MVDTVKSDEASFPAFSAASYAANANALAVVPVLTQPLQPSETLDSHI